MAKIFIEIRDQLITILVDLQPLGQPAPLLGLGVDQSYHVTYSQRTIHRLVNVYKVLTNTWIFCGCARKFRPQTAWQRGQQIFFVIFHLLLPSLSQVHLVVFAGTVDLGLIHFVHQKFLVRLRYVLVICKMLCGIAEHLPNILPLLLVLGRVGICNHGIQLLPCPLQLKSKAMCTVIASPLGCR